MEWETGDDNWLGATLPEARVRRQTVVDHSAGSSNRRESAAR